MGTKLRGFLGVPLLALLFLVGAALSGAWATISVNSATNFTREGSTPNNDNWGAACNPGDAICEMANAINDVTVSLSATTDHLIPGAFIEVRLPEGLEFCAEDDQLAGGTPACGTTDADNDGNPDVLQAVAEMVDLADGVNDGACNLDADAANELDPTPGNIQPIWETYTRDDGQVVKALVGFRIPITDDLTGAATVNLQFNRTAGQNADDLTIKPIRKIDRRPMNECYKMTVAANAGTSGAVSGEVGRICMLTTPQIIKTELKGNDLYVYFNVDIDPDSVTQGAGVDVGTGAGSEFQMNLGGGWGAAVCNVTVEVEDTKTLVFRGATACAGLDTDGNDWLRVDVADFINNALGAWPNAVGFQSGIAVPILAEGVGVSGIVLNKSRVGVNTRDADSDFAGTSRADNANVLQVTIQSSGMSPIFVRMFPAGSQPPVQELTFDTDDGDDVNDDSVIVNDPGFLGAINRAPFIWVPAANNNGLVRLDFALDDTINDNNNAVNCVAGKECTVKLQVSTSPRFADAQEVEIVIDQKAPALVLAGDGAAKALSRTQVQIQFNEEMDRTSVERLFVDNGNGGGTPNDGVRNGNEPVIYCIEDLANPGIIAGQCDNDDIRVTGVSLGSDGKTVTLTTQLLPVERRFRVLVGGVNLPGGADSTNRVGVMDLAGNYIPTTAANPYTASNIFQSPGESLTSVSAVNAVTRAPVVPANNGALRVTVVGPANLGRIFVRAVDANDTSVIVSQNPAFQIDEVSPGVYQTSDSAPLVLVNGISAENIKVLASTDSTFNTGVIESDPIPVDSVRPTVSSAEYVDPNHVKVCFSEQMFATDLANENNYTIPGLQVVDAEVDLDTVKCVTLTTTTQTQGSTYVVDVAAVRDLAGNMINTAADTIGIDRAQWTAGVAPLSANPTSLTLAVGESATITISGGVPPYTVSASGGVTVEPETLDAEGTVTVTAVTTPGGTVTITDSSDPVNPAQVEVNVTVTEAMPCNAAPEAAMEARALADWPFDPAASITVPADRKGMVKVVATMQVPADRQGQTATLYYYISLADGTPVTPTIQSLGEVTLGDTVTFNIFPEALDLSDVSGEFYIYVGFASQPDFSDLLFNYYTVTLE